MDILTRAEQLAVELGEGWSARAGHWSGRDAWLSGPDGESLHVSTDSDRLGISGVFDKEQHDQLHYNERRRFEITVSASKTPATIARDIGRRLLSEYRATLTAVKERVEAVRQAKAERLTLQETLSGLLPGSSERGENEVRFSIGAGYGFVKVHGSGSVEFELHVNGSDALYLAEYLRNFKKA